MKLQDFTLTLFFLFNVTITIAQSYTTVSAGDIESSQTWANGTVPPFIDLGDDIEISSNLELDINHELSSMRSEVINKGELHISLDAGDYPTVNWRNYGNIVFFGWGADTGRFINEASGQILYKNNFSYCQHLGCGSENFGVIYVNTCLSNICAYDSTSRFINHENGEIIICEDGYIENYWRLPWAGPLENLVFINNGLIRADEDSFFEGFIYSGNDFFNNVPNSMGIYNGDEPVLEPQIDCISELPDLMATHTLEKLFDDEISIYPNPSSGQLNIDASIDYDHVKIINALGQVENKIYHNQSSRIVNHSLKPGIYILQVMRGSSIVANKKFICN